MLVSFLLSVQMLRAMRKKMRKINDLIEFQRNGGELDDQQIDLVNSLDDVVDKMESFLVPREIT